MIAANALSQAVPGLKIVQVEPLPFDEEYYDNDDRANFNAHLFDNEDYDSDDSAKLNHEQ
jgi:hypothetical protein